MKNFHFTAWPMADDKALPDREWRVYHTANSLIEDHVFRLPIDIHAICRACGVEVLPLSWYLEQGMAAEDLFAVWGNTDGVASTFGERSVINYNDLTNQNRARFTLSEELMHILLGHTADPRFSVFSQSYEPEIYQQYEHEAKTAAGLVLLPASLYFRHRAAGTRALARVCGISEACAWTTSRFYEANLPLLRKAATQKVLSYDAALLRSAVPYRRPIDVWPAPGERYAL